MISLEDQIKAVGRLLHDLKWARSKPDVPEHATYKALVQIARDLTARTPGEPGKVRKAIGMRIADAVRTKTSSSSSLGYETSHLIGIGQNVIGEWPVIEHALETVERMEKSK